MVYELLRINRAMAGNVKSEIWAWNGISDGKKPVGLVPLTIFWALQKKKIGELKSFLPHLAGQKPIFPLVKSHGK